jgi:hypothetical protein
MSNNAGNTLVALVGGIAIGAGIGFYLLQLKGRH